MNGVEAHAFCSGSGVDKYFMIYLTEKSFSRQIDALEYLARDRVVDVIAWIYPESSVKSILDVDVMSSNPEGLEPVTTYNDETVQARRTPIMRWSSAIKSLLLSANSEIKKNVDSLCCYEDGNKQWFSCTIGHEGMVLVREDTHLKELQSCGFSASLDPPDWW